MGLFCLDMGLFCLCKEGDIEMGMQLTDREKKLVIAGYMNGYDQGHHDTVESGYTDPEESGRDWLKDALEDDGLKHSVEQLSEI